MFYLAVTPKNISVKFCGSASASFLGKIQSWVTKPVAILSRLAEMKYNLVKSISVTNG